MDGSHLTRTLALATHAGLAASVVGATALHVGWSTQVDAIRQTVSDYALSEGADAVFTGTVASLSAGSTALLASLVHSRLPVGRTATVLLGAWCGGLVLTASFRTDPIDSAPTAHGLIHRYATGVAVAALPAAGLLISRRLGHLPHCRSSVRSLRRVSWAGAAAGAGFLATHLCARRPTTAAARWVGDRHGLAERVTLALELGVLGALAAAMCSGRSRT
ncbi:DUF998 domain-containing protein [Streptomyces sp. NPDC093085]|uniref:DUF998 domain-containing protein n=1 Tax=Streptomyces sp. NPDC093085 TaxID=3155068 RepID=UPI00342348C7